MLWKMSELWDEMGDRFYEMMAGKALGAVSPEKEPSKAQIIWSCAELCAMLLYKNEHYGDSVLTPYEAVPTGTTAAQACLIRINDKLKRLKMGTAKDDEDTWMDLCGYIILYRIAKRREGQPIDRDGNLYCPKHPSQPLMGQVYGCGCPL